MTRPAPGNLKAASKPALKSPLRASTMPCPVTQPHRPVRPTAAPRNLPGAAISAPQLRKMQISEFSAWLRTQTNKHQRPFQEETIRDYAQERKRGLGIADPAPVGLMAAGADGSGGSPWCFRGMRFWWFRPLAFLRG